MGEERESREKGVVNKRVAKRGAGSGREIGGRMAKGDCWGLLTPGKGGKGVAWRLTFYCHHT